MPWALQVVLPATTLQTCIEHLIRNSLDYADWKESRAIARRCVRFAPQSALRRRKRRKKVFARSEWAAKI